MTKDKKNSRSRFFWPFVLLSSFFTTVFLLTDRHPEVTSFAEMLKAMNGSRIAGLLTMLAAMLIFHKAWQIREPREKRFAFFGSAVFTLLDFVGFNIYFRDSLTRLEVNVFSLALDLACILGGFLLLGALLLLLFHWILNRQDRKTVPNPRADKWFSDNLRSFFLYFGIFMAVNLCLQIFFYPGILTLDSLVQVEEGLGIRPLSDRNPIVLTMVMKYIISFGRLIFGSVTAGVAFYTMVQSVLVGLTVSFTLVYMARRGFPLGLRIGSLVYFTIHPAIACYSVTLWKDIWLSYFLLLFVIFSYEIVLNGESFFSKKSHMVFLGLTMLGILFAKNTGIFLLVFTLPFLLFAGRKHWKQLGIVTLICLSLFLCVHKIILPAAGVQKGHAAEPYSVPLQQVARTVTKEGDSLTQEQIDTISEILPYEKIPQLYDRTLSDNIKLALDQGAFTENLGKYAKTWLDIGLSHPRAYVESFLANSCGYWYPDVIYWQVATGIDFHEPGTPPVPEEEGFNPQHYFVHLYEQLQIVPGISTLLSTAIYFWACFLLLLISLLKRKPRVLIPMAAALGVWGLCLLSPVISEFRYAFPAVVCLPVYAAFVLEEPVTLTDALGPSRKK